MIAIAFFSYIGRVGFCVSTLLPRQRFFAVPFQDCTPTRPQFLRSLCASPLGTGYSVEYSVTVLYSCVDLAFAVEIVFSCIQS